MNGGRTTVYSRRQCLRDHRGCRVFCHEDIVSGPCSQDMFWKSSFASGREDRSPSREQIDHGKGRIPSRESVPEQISLKNVFFAACHTASRPFGGDGWARRFSFEQDVCDRGWRGLPTAGHEPETTKREKAGVTHGPKWIQSLKGYASLQNREKTIDGMLGPSKQ